MHFVLACHACLMAGVSANGDYAMAWQHDFSTDYSKGMVLAFPLLFHCLLL